jgi:type II secretory pathway pseudopilin PulG
LLRNNRMRERGFTLPEVILIVGILTILTGMAFPDIVSFFKRQQLEQEKLAQAEISKAIDAYARERLTLPTDPATWHVELSQFTNMTPDAIRRDVWGRDRQYIAAIDTRPYRETELNIFYATVRSDGENKANDTNATWADKDQYGAYQATSDDILLKYTDLPVKTQRYDETILRMERIITALDRYSQARFNEAVITDDQSTGNVNNKIFYPRSSNDGSGAPYGSKVEEDTSNFNSGPIDSSQVCFDSGTGQAVDCDMRNLMKVLGLPEDHCCSALTNEPFRYYSNPLPQVSGCGQPARTSPPYMPPKIAIDNLSCE